MRARWSQLFLYVMAMVMTLPAVSFAAGGGGSPIVIVADTRKLDGILAWWANLYNESHFQFMILTVILIPVTGVVFGVIADIIMNAIGIDLKSKELPGH